MAIDPTNPINDYGPQFEMDVTNAWALALDANQWREGVTFQNNSAGAITLSKTNRGVAGQGVVVLAAGGGFFSEQGEPDINGEIRGVHKGKWYAIAAAAGPFKLLVSES